MAARNFSNTAVATTLSSGIGAGDGSLVVLSASGWPAAPFILVIEPDTGNEELIEVGSKSGTTFSSLGRGFGGTSGVAHNAASEIKMVAVAEDHALVFSHVHVPGTDDTTQIDHESLGGRSDDDHALYLKEKAQGGVAAEVPTHDHSGAPEAGTIDHGALTGSSDDDHGEYLKEEAFGGVAAEVPTHDHSAAAEAGLLGFVGVRAGRVTSAFQIASGSDIVVEWNAETFDSDGFHDNVTNNSRFTVPAGLGGKYAVHGMLLMPGGSLGGSGRIIKIRKNGTTDMASGIMPTVAGSIISPSLSIHSLIDLVATDYLEILGQQDTGSDRNVTGVSDISAFFEMHLVGV